MKGILAFVILAGALVLPAADVHAWAGGPRHGGGTGEFDSTRGDYNGKVPEPSALYAVGTGLALLGGAGWYIRRRK